MDQSVRNAVLTFLYNLSDSNENIGSSTNADAIRFSSSNNISNRLTTNYGGGNIFLDSGGGVHHNSSSLPLSLSDHQLNNNNHSSNHRQSAIPSSSLSDHQLKTLAQRSGGAGALSHSSSSTDFSCKTIDDPAKIAAAAHIEEIVQDVIYAATGIQGKFLKKDIISGGFKLDPKIRSLTITESVMLLRLAELGYYHDNVQSFTDAKSGRSPLGLLGQGFVTALKSELTEYYGMVAMLQEQLQQKKKSLACTDGANITLMKVMLWAAEPLNRLFWLNAIGEECQEKKGGELATTVANFLHNGDPSVKSLTKNLCLAVCGPLVHMLKKWLLEGEIDDPHSEFFIECLPEIGPELLWSDKYRVRDAMLPQFISR